MWHSNWDTSRWTEPLPVVSGPLRNVENAGDIGFDPSHARAVVSQGNVILVTWSTDPGVAKNGLWYSHTSIESPELPIVLLPTPIPTTTALKIDATITPHTSSTLDPNQSITITDNLFMPSNNINFIGIIAGFAPAVIILIVLIVNHKSRK